jgi:hypothetical protein
MRVMMGMMVMAMVMPVVRRRQCGAREKNQRDSDCDKLAHKRTQPCKVISPDS